jgi:cyclopropane fatty-acyl-phospholipid synthase-like methyltransferase
MPAVDSDPRISGSPSGAQTSTAILEREPALPPPRPPESPGKREDRSPTATTVHCYEFWDRVFCRTGVIDYTEGYYKGDATLPYEEAQHNQICHLLDEAECRAGSRILDVGCGNGRLLEEARQRGAAGVGITISPHQAEFCRQRGLDVRLLNYRDIGEEWNGRFDAVIANGSMEHFVQPQDAAGGHGDAIYADFFALCHRLLDPHSESRKFINTTIHFGRYQPDPHNALKGPWAFRPFSDDYHYAWLMRGFGGYYPTPGQFERCARPCFRLLRERDATFDYHLTSEEWLRRGKRSLWSVRDWARLFPFGVCHPLHTSRMLFALLVAQSWNWQFRGEQPPMKHLWQTWERQDVFSGRVVGA